MPDSTLASAVDFARAAVIEEATLAKVGDHIDTVSDGDLVVTHYFACSDRAYVGWRWAVTLTRVTGSDHVTVDEIVLLPGPDSLLAPEWLPWSDRVRPGDLTPGDLYPTAPDDPRLEPGFTGADALELDDETGSGLGVLRPEQWQIGLGREVVLSAFGRGVAADRWFDGDFGPEAPMARNAPGTCGSCGFLMPIGGLTGQAFGLCANEYGADGRVVAFGYGCGAHSSVREIQGTGIPVTEMALDELRHELIDLSTVEVVSVSVDPALELSAEDVAESSDDDALFTVAVVAAGDLVDEPVDTDTDIDDVDVDVDVDLDAESLDDADVLEGELGTIADELLAEDEADDLDEDDDEDDDDEDDDEDDDDEVDDDEVDDDEADDLEDVDDLEPDEIL